MQNLENKKEYLTWKLAAAAISLATTVSIFNIHSPKQGVITRAELSHMFERESEVLHMHPSYGARARYATILGE
jgi:hypothetical protein